MFPIPPGVHWKDVRAVAVPTERGRAILPEPNGDGRKRSGGTPRPRKRPPTPDAGTVGILVGAVVAITFKSGVDDPFRFRRSRDVGAHFGLTPRKYQSGEIDVTGSISCARKLYSAYNPKDMKQCVGACIACDRGVTTTNQLQHKATLRVRSCGRGGHDASLPAGLVAVG